MVEAEGTGEPAIDIARQLITQDDHGYLAHLVSLPVRHFTVADVYKILLEQQGDLGVSLRATTEPSLHHGRRHLRVAVPLLLVGILLSVQVDLVEVGARRHHFVEAELSCFVRVAVF